MKTRFQSDNRKKKNVKLSDPDQKQTSMVRTFFFSKLNLNQTENGWVWVQGLTGFEKKEPIRMIVRFKLYFQ